MLVVLEHHLLEMELKVQIQYFHPLPQRVVDLVLAAVRELLVALAVPVVLVVLGQAQPAVLATKAVLAQ